MFTNPVVPPAVPAGQAVPAAHQPVMATHTPEQIDFCLEACSEKIGREMGVI